MPLAQSVPHEPSLCINGAFTMAGSSSNPSLKSIADAVWAESPSPAGEIDTIHSALRRRTLQDADYLVPRGAGMAPHAPAGLFIYGQRDRLPDPQPRLLPDRIGFWVRGAGLIALIVGVYYGPPYVTCRQMKERGMFYYGTTISTCMKERMEERNATLDALARKLTSAI